MAELIFGTLINWSFFLSFFIGEREEERGEWEREGKRGGEWERDRKRERGRKWEWE